MMPKMLEKSLNRIEDFYLGDGWYQDGLTAQKDYYIPFALHFYSLVYVLAMENEDSNRCRRYRARAAEFAKQFVYWFSEEGPCAALWPQLDLPLRAGGVLEHCRRHRTRRLYPRARSRASCSVT